jgi:hypothetical protein
MKDFIELEIGRTRFSFTGDEYCIKNIYRDDLAIDNKIEWITVIASKDEVINVLNVPDSIIRLSSSIDAWCQYQFTKHTLETKYRNPNIIKQKFLSLFEE